MEDETESLMKDETEICLFQVFYKLSCAGRHMVTVQYLGESVDPGTDQRKQSCKSVASSTLLSLFELVGFGLAHCQFAFHSTDTTRFNKLAQLFIFLN